MKNWKNRLKYWLGVSSLILCSSMSFVAVATEPFKPLLSPEAALIKLLAGNERFVQGKSTCPQRSPERRLAQVTTQTPFAAIVGCSDSRVSPDLIFDQGISDLFVVRNAGNIMGDLELDSIEYAVRHLKVSLILVMGHENCGAVTAVLKGQVEDIAAIAAAVEPAIKGIKSGEPGALEKAIKANVVANLAKIRQSSFLKPLIAEQKISVLGAYYNLQTGRVELLNLEL